jgi:hypothetical protein
MLHKSPTYCSRQISFTSLIFNMGAISMKFNPVYVSILIIATSLAIHQSTHIQPSHWLWGILNLGSYYSPHTFSKVSSPVVMGRSDPGLLSWPSHLLSKVSLPVIIRRSELELLSWPSHLLSKVSSPFVIRWSKLGLLS